MKVEDFRKMTDEERAKKTRELREELGNLAFQHKLRPLEDTSRMKKIKKDIARLMTIAREKSAS